MNSASLWNTECELGASATAKRMSFGLGDVLPKAVLHRLQLGVWGAASGYSCIMISNGLLRRHLGSQPAQKWPLKFCMLNACGNCAVLAMLSIDGSFDYELLASGNSEAMTRQSWIYYRTMLTNPIVNIAAFLCFLIICVMPAVMNYDIQCWEYLRGMIGTFFYTAVIGAKGHTYVHSLYPHVYNVFVLYKTQCVRKLTAMHRAIISFHSAGR